MCGFTGQYLYDLNAAVNPALLESRTRRLKHRGPEALGIWNKGHIGLAHARLKLIDFENGAQPMHSPSGTVLAYNGEIYNNTELRAELTVHGYTFTTRSDTEVVLAAYDIWGSKAWLRFNGMFALALYDPEKEMLFLVRDRLGVKPLFYKLTSNGIEFGSEPTGWEHIHKRESSLLPSGVLHFLRFAQPAAGNKSVYSDLHVLEPGTQLSVEKSGGCTIERWFTGTNLIENPCMDEVAVRANLRHFLHLAVGRQMMADAPVGIFLSGGIDSAILVGLYSHMSPQPPCTFTIALEGDDVEFAAARAVANKWKTQHHEFKVSPAEYFAAMHELIHIRQLPASVPNEVLIYLLAKQARRDIKIALTGEGADELFGGYSSLLSRLYLYTHVSQSAATGNPLLMRALRMENPDWKQDTETGFFSNVYSWLSIKDLREILTPEWQKFLTEFEQHDPFRIKFTEFNGLSANNRFHALLEYAHLPGLLARLDGATMAASLEGRVPYTDTDLVHYMSCLSPSFKYNPNQQGKRLLRQTFSDIMPLEVLSRPKRAFNVPLEILFESEEGRFELEKMTENKLMSEIVNLNQMKMWINSNTVRKNGMKVWLLLSLSMWLNRNI